MSSLLHPQGCIAVRSYVLVTQHADPHYIQLIMGYQILTIIGLFFLVMAFVRLTPFIVSGISLTVYVFTAVYLNDPPLWKIFCYFVFVELFVSVVGELLRRNVTRVAVENKSMHHRETVLMRAVRLNSREMEAYLLMGNNDDPTMREADRFFAMLKPKSKRNLINAVRLGKTENNIDVVRTHVRRKLNVPADQNLSQFLADQLTVGKK